MLELNELISYGVLCFPHDCRFAFSLYRWLICIISSPLWVSAAMNARFFRPSFVNCPFGYAKYIQTNPSNRKVRLVDPSSVHWFPGHMRKGMNQIGSKMVNVDVLIEIHDARVPFTGRSEFFLKFGQVS